MNKTEGYYMQEVEAILKLQNIDLKIIEVKHVLEKFPATIEKLQKQKEEIKKSYLAFEDGLKKQKLLQKQFDGEVEAEKEKLIKTSLQLNAIKTNADYTTKLKEIENIKQNIKGIDDKLLDLMEKAESEEKVRNLKSKEINEEVQRIDNNIKEHNKEIELCKSQLTQLEKERKQAALECSGDLYHKYEKYIERKRSIALVPLEKNGACSGCHRNLPPNIRNDVMKGRVVLCDNCARLLFWVPELAQVQDENKEV